MASFTYKLYWDTNGRSEVTYEPSLNDILSKLCLVENSSGTVSLTHAESGQLNGRLTVHAVDGHFLLSLYESLAEKDRVRTSTNPNPVGKSFVIDGELWTDVEVVDSFPFVTTAFEEFYRTGTVREELMD